MRFFTLAILTILVSGCTVSEVRQSPNLKNELKSLKRILVVTEKNLAMEQEELNLISEISRNYISHHKEFIVYPSGIQKSSCAQNPKIQGIFFIKFRELKRADEITILAIGRLKDCKSFEELWSAVAEKTVRIDAKENASLVKTYVEKFGNKIESKVTPYFLTLKALIDELQNPSPLTEDEQNEKIEVESES